jgi:pimeloyl-ACP methyl ester carboxylesterase
MSHANPGQENRQEHRVIANGLDHRVHEWLPTSQELSGTAFLIHGYMDAGASWGGVASQLTKSGLRVLAPDLRGYGDSARAPRGSYYHFQDYVADVADLVLQLVGRTPLLLVGHSMGGTIATLYAGAFPETVTKLASLEGIGPPDNGFADMPDRMRTWIEQVRSLRAPAGGRGKSIGTMEDALRRLSANHAGVPQKILRARLPDLVSDDGNGHVAWKGDPLHKPPSPMPFFARAYLAFARRITCPTLYMSGGPDGFHPSDQDERLGAFARVERFELRDAGHMMHWTRPDEVAARLVEFWRAA